MSDITNGLLEELQKKPYSKITVANICRKSGISRSTFYRNFHSKQDCLHALIGKHLTAADAAVALYGPQQYFTYWMEHRDFLKLIKENVLHSVLLEQAVLFVSQQYSTDWDLYRIRFVVSGTLGLILQWLDRGCRETPAELQKTHARILSVSLTGYPESNKH